MRENSVSGFSDILTNIGFRLSETRYKIPLCVAFYLGLWRCFGAYPQCHSSPLIEKNRTKVKACETEKNLLEPEARHSGWIFLLVFLLGIPNPVLSSINLYTNLPCYAARFGDLWLDTSSPSGNHVGLFHVRLCTSVHTYPELSFKEFFFSLISPHTRSTILSYPQLLTKLRCKLVILRK